MKVPLRYEMNMGVLTKKDLDKLQRAKVAVVGLGGLGGHVVNQLVRLGLKHITLIDFDQFSESNLNRQLFATMKSIGQYKVNVVSKALKEINPDLMIEVYLNRVQDLKDLSVDYLIDCVDNTETKIYLSQLSKQLNVPLLHGSCGGWYGQVGWISPQCSLIEMLYQNEEKGLENALLNPPFIVNVVASYMVSEFVKMIKDQSKTVFDELLLIDLDNNVLLKSGGVNHG